MARPGGPLPLDARTYVRREADYYIKPALSDGRAPSNIVVAAINGGASSFLARVYQQAQGHSNYWTCFLHLDTAFPDGERINQLDLFRYVLEKIEMPHDQLAQLDVEGMKEAFDAWARNAWRDLERVVLIIDGIGQVLKSAASVTDVNALTNWLAALRFEAALGQPPYNKLIQFTAFAGTAWSAAHASPYATQAATLQLSKFAEKQIPELFTPFGIHQSGNDAHEVFSLFHGHPYLTQLFAWSLYEGASMADAREKALGLEGAYEEHWERVKSEIQSRIGGGARELGKVLSVASEVTEGPDYFPLKDAALHTWLEFGRDLRIFGLLDGTRKAPTICEFYRNAIDNEPR